MSEKIDVIIKRPGNGLYIERIDNTLEALQEIVGGYIEVIRFTEDAAVICNEEGKLMGLPYNIDLFGEPFVGNIVFIGVKGEEFTDLPMGKVNFLELFLSKKKKPLPQTVTDSEK